MNVFKLKSLSSYELGTLVSWIARNGHNPDQLLDLHLDVNSNQYTAKLILATSKEIELSPGDVIEEVDGIYSKKERKDDGQI